jgi:hypothetical protein
MRLSFLLCHHQVVRLAEAHSPGSLLAQLDNKVGMPAWQKALDIEIPVQIVVLNGGSHINNETQELRVRANDSG